MGTQQYCEGINAIGILRERNIIARERNVIARESNNLIYMYFTLSFRGSVDFNDVRQRFYQVPFLQDLFKTVKPEVILDFLKAAALYRLSWKAYDCMNH